ncbi:MAG: ABC transporter substrate-binding protein [Chloroflexota bacterium]
MLEASTAATDQLVLRAAIGTYPHTAPLKSGKVTSPRVRLDVVELPNVNRAFRPMINDLAYDVSEMAIVTLLLGHSRQRPVHGIPAVLRKISPFAAVTCRSDANMHAAKDLEGRTIAVRAYAQTTGVWLRGILHEEYGVALDKIRWVTLEPAHLDGFEDPANCRRAPAETSLLDLLRRGEADAAVGLEGAEGEPGLQPLFADAAELQAAWIARTGIQPINHVLTLTSELDARYPWLRGELYQLFMNAREASEAGPASAPTFGLAPNKSAIEKVAGYACEQGIIPRVYPAEDLFPALISAG